MVHQIVNAVDIRQFPPMFATCDKELASESRNWQGVVHTCGVHRRWGIGRLHLVTFSGEADKCLMMFHSPIYLVTKCLIQGRPVFLIAVIVGPDRSILERIYRAITGEYYHV